MIASVAFLVKTISVGGGVEEARGGLAGPFISVGRGIGEEMQAPMDVGIFLAIGALHGVQHRLGLLRRGGVVQIDQRLAIDLARQDREILADFRDVERGCHRAVSLLPLMFCQPAFMLLSPRHGAMTGGHPALQPRRHGEHMGKAHARRLLRRVAAGRSARLAAIEDEDAILGGGQIGLGEGGRIDIDRAGQMPARPAAARIGVDDDGTALREEIGDLLDRKLGASCVSLGRP